MTKAEEWTCLHRSRMAANWTFTSQFWDQCSGTCTTHATTLGVQ